MGSLRSAAHPVPVDLLAAVGLTIASNAAVFVPGLRDTPLRVLLGFVFVSLVPGYVVVAALFPEGLHAADGDSEGGPRPPDQRGTAGTGGVTVTERLLLSVGVSLVVVPAIGYAWNFTPGGVRLVPVLLSVSGFSVAVAGLAALRRRRLPADAQFRPRLPGRFGGARSDDSGVPRLVNAVLVLSVLCFAASAGYAAVELSHDERYSELSLVSPDGERFAGTGGSPVVTAGDRQTVGVAVGNHEGRATNYTVVVVQQTVDDAGNGTVVGSQIRLDQFTVAVADNETVVRNHTVAPPARGNRSRVVWLLYAGETPDSPSVDSAANHVYLWVTSNETDVESRAPR